MLHFIEKLALITLQLHVGKKTHFVNLANLRFKPSVEAACNRVGQTAKGTTSCTERNAERQTERQTAKWRNKRHIVGVAEGVTAVAVRLTLAQAGILPSRQQTKLSNRVAPVAVYGPGPKRQS